MYTNFFFGHYSKLLFRYSNFNFNFIIIFPHFFNTIFNIYFFYFLLFFSFIYLSLIINTF